MSSKTMTVRSVGDAQGDFSGAVRILGYGGDKCAEEDGVLPR